MFMILYFAVCGGYIMRFFRINVNDPHISPGTKGRGVILMGMGQILFFILNHNNIVT